VQPTEVSAAAAVLERLAGSGHVRPSEDDAGWLTVHTGQDQGAAVNRALAESGIFASALSSSSDLEELFLELTRGNGEDPEGVFAGQAPAAPAEPQAGS
jgi:hypothetical protein